MSPPQSLSHHHQYHHPMATRLGQIFTLEIYRNYAIRTQAEVIIFQYKKKVR